MLNEIRGLHHVTAMASDARRNNFFFTDTLGLRRVKKTVNFDAPEVYHLYYADGAGTPGSVMTYFPFPNIARRHPGTGEAALTAFSVPTGSLGWWRERLEKAGAGQIAQESRFSENRLSFSGPDGESLALVEVAGDGRTPWTGGGVGGDHAIRGFHSVSLRLKDEAATLELLKFMGYREAGEMRDIRRLALPAGNGAGVIDLETAPQEGSARQGAGSVHHIAFAVDDRAAQTRVREALAGAGYQVTPVIDRDYFWAIYFRTPGGVLFEIATNEPGFARDEDAAHLGEALKLPRQHAHLRPWLEENLQPLEG